MSKASSNLCFQITSNKSIPIVDKISVKLKAQRMQRIRENEQTKLQLKKIKKKKKTEILLGPPRMGTVMNPIPENLN